MIIKTIKIIGLRGFRTEQQLNLAIPNGEVGSGLTILVGPNNSGKSTIIEAFQAISSRYYQTPSFSTGKRNKKAGDSILITVNNEDNNSIKLKSIIKGSSETKFQEENGIKKEDLKVFVVPSRRNFEPFFGKNEMDRESFLSNTRIQHIRSTHYNNFQSRLFQVQSNPDKFNQILSDIFGEQINWTIDLSDEGQHFIKLIFGEATHNSDGAGEGLLSIFTIVDALYDSQPKETIIIDEPELSLHPALQKRLFKVLDEFSKDRQIVISTHSPYFINWQSLINGGSIARVINNGSGTTIYNLNESVKSNLKGLINNLFNPHILGLDANEIFFLDEKIILVEGQEDVIYFNRIVDLLDLEIRGSFFGWGVGGAGNMQHILALLKDLGFEKVVIIFDADKNNDFIRLQKKYTSYSFHIIPTDDIRDKPEIKPRDAIKGLIDTGGKIVKEKYKEPIIKIFDAIDSYLN